METLIRNFFTHLSLVFLVLANLVAVIRIIARKTSPWEELFKWNALLGVGTGCMYAFMIHAFFPAMSARAVGWDPSPFQWEVAMANFGVGLLGILSFRAGYGFRVATVISLVCWFWGAAIGQVRQMIVAGNFAPGNAGSWFWLDVLAPALMIALIVAMKKDKAA